MTTGYGVSTARMPLELRAREELVAEIGSMMLGDTLGIGFSPENGSAYVKAWLLALEEDSTEIYHASTDAWQIVDWLLGTVDTRSSASEREPGTPSLKLVR